LRFAITWSPAHVNLHLVGVILMIGGALGLIISLVFLARRSRTTARPQSEVYERRYTDSPGRYSGPPD
jgi:hypothetical protein